MATCPDCTTTAALAQATVPTSASLTPTAGSGARRPPTSGPMLWKQACARAERPLARAVRPVAQWMLPAPGRSSGCGTRAGQGTGRMKDEWNSCPVRHSSFIIYPCSTAEEWPFDPSGLRTDPCFTLYSAPVPLAFCWPDTTVPGSRFSSRWYKMRALSTERRSAALSRTKNGISIGTSTSCSHSLHSTDGCSSVSRLTNENRALSSLTSTRSSCLLIADTPPPVA